MTNGLLVIEGFVIAPPLSPWDEKHGDKIIPEMAYGSFAPAAFEAWSRHIGPANAASDSRATIIQRWHDKGYRLKRARMEIFA